MDNYLLGWIFIFGGIFGLALPFVPGLIMIGLGIALIKKYRKIKDKRKGMSKK